MSGVQRNILDALNWGTRILRERGVESPRVDAALLLRKALNINQVDIFLKSNQMLTQNELTSYEYLIKRRLGGEPVHYVLGKREFWSMDLRVTPGVLIPRPETELLVEQTLKTFGDRRSDTLRFMEVGTGSGAIAIALAKELEGCFIVAEDISPAAILVAEENAKAQGVSSTIRFVVGDLFSAFKEEKSQFDLIISNPPYIPSSQIGTLPGEIGEFEPKIALDGGPDGLGMMRNIVGRAASLLKDGGWLMLELGEGQGEVVEDMIRKTGFYTSSRITRDYSGTDRVIRARKGEGAVIPRGVAYG